MASNDDLGEDRNFLIRTPLGPGTYYIQVSSFFSDTGDYNLYVDVVTVTEIELNTSVSGTIDPRNDVDYFRIEIDTPADVNIFTTDTSNLYLLGTLQDNMGTELASDMIRTLTF